MSGSQNVTQVPSKEAEALQLLEQALLRIRSEASKLQINMETIPESLQKSVAVIYGVSDAMHNIPRIVAYGDGEMQTASLQVEIDEARQLMRTLDTEYA